MERKKFRKSFFDYEKKFPPLSLKYTLEQIEGVVELLKGDFIESVIEISKSIFDGSFDDNLLPNIEKVTSLVEDLSLAVEAEK